MTLADTVSPSGGSVLAAYGPVLVAGAAIISALVAALTRRDKKSIDRESQLDARTKTALDALTETLEAVTKNRDEQRQRADALEAKVAECERKAQDQAAQIELLRDQLAGLAGINRTPTRRPRKGTG